ALDGLPGLCPGNALKVQESHLLFIRCVQLLFVTFSSGGQVSLEQTTNSMAWLEPLASHFLREIQADLINIAACSVGLDMHKSWIFATCFRPLQALASVCEHPHGSHEDIRGSRDADGPSEPPVSVQDGAGIFSVPDWSIPPRRASEITSLRGIFEHWLSAQAKPTQVSWHIAEGQPYCLEALQLVSAICSGRDTTLFPCPLSGVPAGFDADIPLSNVLVPPGTGHPFAQEVAICHSNWSSAEADPVTLHQLVEEELSKGWLFEVDSLASAQERFGSKLAIGKMSIVNAPGKKPRLVVDSTTNPSCVIPETFSLPTLMTMHAGKLAGFALDVKSAHKT
ncbi:unnamed protein product, partial [Symbiodinium pilosum]